MRVAIQGEAGAFSHEAATNLLPEATVTPCSYSSEVFQLLGQGAVDAAVIPIENSLAGPVVEHYDLLLRHDAGIERESLLRIRHNLIAPPGTRLEDLQLAYSHPVALAQCRRFFEEHPLIHPAPFYDTAGSVKRLMETREPNAAAIASTQAARSYGGEILLAGIEDNPENYTRFFLIRRLADLNTDPASDKVSIAFSVENSPGTLVRALEVFAEQGTNLTKIESRPVPGRPWEYVFYCDYQLSTPESADAALRLLKPYCSMIKELGRYRAARLGS